MAGVSAQKIAESVENQNPEKTISENNKMLKTLAAMQKLEEEKSNLLKENQKLIKMGIIAELKEGLEGEAAVKFERCANNVVFEKSSRYINKLENLKQAIIDEAKLAEKCHEEPEEPEEEAVSEEYVRVPTKSPVKNDYVKVSRPETLNESREQSDLEKRLSRLY